MLTEPLPTQKFRKPAATPATVEQEGQDFMALMQQTKQKAGA